jgi:hypothetical protein
MRVFPFAECSRNKKNPHASAGNIHNDILRQLAGIAPVGAVAPLALRHRLSAALPLSVLYILVHILYTQLENIARLCRKISKYFFTAGK